MKPNGLFILMFCLFLAVCVQAQVITGRVVDADSGKPIPNASVYLNGTSKGTTSNGEGKFSLSTAEKNIPLIVSCVGYQSQTIDNYSNGNLNVALKVKPLVLQEVVIGGMSREEQLKIFLTQFIGSTNKNCVISNTEDINFTYHKKTGTLEADASQPLVIYNKKLGYKLTYFLSYFKYSPVEIRYEGNYFFKEDTAGLTPNDVKKIHKARDAAYFGSRMHFIRALWANNLEKNNYFISDTSYNSAQTIAAGIKRYGKVYMDDKRIRERDFYNYLVKAYNGEKYIAPKRPLIIKYRGNTSYLQIDTNSTQVLIENNGYYNPNIIWSGVMVGQRINAMLPFEYMPPGVVLTLPPIDAALAQKAAQPDTLTITNKNLKNYIRALTAIHEYKPIEKLYVQTDKPYYTTGDTLRFKAYLLNADYLTPADRSGLLYVELDDQTGKAAKRIMVPVEKGLAWGDIALDGKEIPEGSYTFRAYTNWQRNFGEDYVFKKNITIAATRGDAQLIKAAFAQKNGKIESTLQFTSLDGHVQALKDMQLKVMNGRKNVSKDKVMTGIDGTVSVSFAIPEGASIKDLAVKAKDISKGTAASTQELTIPVTINRPENTDIQFMPEGGNLIAGITSKVGVKAIAEDGKGANITGTITDSKQQEVAQFKTSHAGMGSFTFTPKANETYTAKIPNNTKTYTLPTINPTGTTLKLTQTADSIQITVTTIPTSTTTTTSPTTYNLIGQSRGVVCYAQTIDLSNNSQQIKTAAANQFPTGIARFTLINSNHEPINERQVFINHHDELNISIATNKPSYTIRDSVALAIMVKDKDGKPVQGNFSLAVTDDSQVKTDSLATNLLSNLLLTSDLKGNIENPNYYFIDPTKKQAELDNLLLTQGWVGYNWQDVFYPDTKPIVFQPEKEFTVNGTVTNAFGAAIYKSNVALIAGHPLTIRDTITNKEGQFIFKGLFPVDTALFKIQARNKNGKENNVKIEMNAIKPPEFGLSEVTKPWYINGDSITINNSKTKVAQIKAIANYNGEGNMLKEVVINAKKVVKGSKNLNGPGEADLILDEKDMEKAGKMNMEDLLLQKITGFLVTPWPASSRAPLRLSYTLYNREVHIVIDGLDLDYFYDPGMERPPLDMQRYTYMRGILQYFSAEDVVGIELMKQPKYATNYNIEYLKKPLLKEPDPYIEITTRSKQGQFYKAIPGTYLYKTLPFTLPKQFYSPKYTVKSKTTAMGTDMRSTLYWEPNVVTDKAGKAVVSFYTADKKAGYTIIMNGADLNGGLGYKRQQLINVTALQ
ncbi:MAG: carboxypeptidase-like regulatory domain-containing protein [Mucilaginibacter sp.]